MTRHFNSKPIFFQQLINQQMPRRMFENQRLNDEEIEQVQPAGKSKTVSQVYVCTCGKLYYSFPALYLHNKNKHDIILKSKIKKTMKKKQVWSGKVKKIVYQFPEDDELPHDFHEKIQTTSKYQLRRKKPKSSDPKEVNLKKQIVQNSISEVLDTFTHEISNNINEFQISWIRSTISELRKCLNQNYHKIYCAKNTFENYCNQNQAHNLPFSFNFFTTSYLPSNGIHFNLSLFQLLIKLSEWLYKNKHTSSVAMPNEETQ